MVNIKTLSTGDIFYYVHRHHWFFTLQIVDTNEEHYVLCRHLTRKEPYFGRIEPFEWENAEYFLELDEAEAYYNASREEKRKELSNRGRLLDCLFSYAKEEIPEMDLEFYQEAVEQAKKA